MLLAANDGDTRQERVSVLPEQRPSPDLARGADEARGEVAQGRNPAARHGEEAEPKTKQPVGSGKDSRKHAKSRHPITSAVVLFISATALAGGYIYWDFASHFEWTDDAFVASRQFAVAPKASGYIAAVPVTDNQHVAPGDVIARIDDRDYRVALKQAQAQVAAAEASIANTDAQIEVQEAQVSATQAQIERAQAALLFAEQQAVRYESLAAHQVGTVQNAQQYTSGFLQQEAEVRNVQAARSAAQRQIQSLKAQRSSAEANLAAARAQRDQAQLNLSYTTVIATQSGSVVNLTAAVGQFALADTNLMMFVPDEIWVVANYKESQLAEMRLGQLATMRIDAYPRHIIHGRVESIQPGSGTAFSLLPAQNATGNYVKIVQRVPVKLVILDPPNDVVLGPGMSIVPTVRVRPEPSLYEWLRGWL